MSWAASPGGQQGSASLGYPSSNSGNQASSSVQASSGPNFRWWIPASGIRKDVIEADVQRYLGPQAVIRPGKGRDENAGRNGYWIAAYRTFTSEMIRDLKADSANFERSGDQGSYRNSAVHQSRQYWGPTIPETPTSTTNRPAREELASQGQPSVTAEPAALQGSQSMRDYYREQYAQQPQNLPAGYRPESSRPVSEFPERSSSLNTPYSQQVPSGYGQTYEYSQRQAADAFVQPQGPTGYAQPYGRASDQQPYQSPQTRVGQQPYALSVYDTQSPYAASHSQPRRDPQPYVQPVYDTRTASAASASQTTHPSASRQARPGYYLASDGNYYPESTRPNAS